jgi:hypothetical protein
LRNFNLYCGVVTRPSTRVMKYFFVKIIVCTLIYFLCTTHIAAQIEDTSYIRAHAILIADRRASNHNVYSSLSSYQIILVGELHGSKEPAEFIEGITRTFLNHDREVIIGMEIPATDMTEFTDSGTAESLTKTKFFTNAVDMGTDGDGRASEAWANLLMAFKDSKVKYKFFDATPNQYKGGSNNRDSMMYDNINRILIENPAAVFIGLCGGYHNLLRPDPYHCPMGWYLMHAANSALTDTTKMISLDHVFDTGAFYANTGQSGPTGLRINEFKKSISGTFGTAVKYDNYLLIGKGHEGYSGILYSRTIHASEVWLTNKRGDK